MINDHKIYVYSTLFSSDVISFMPRVLSSFSTGVSNLVKIFTSAVQLVILVAPLLAVYETSSDHVTEYILMAVWMHMLLRGSSTDEFAMGSNVLASWLITLFAALVSIQVIDQQLGDAWSITDWTWTDFALNWSDVLLLRDAHNSVFMWSVAVALDFLYPVFVNSAAFISTAMRGFPNVKPEKPQHFYFVPHSLLVLFAIVTELIIVLMMVSAYGWSRTVTCEVIKAVVLAFALVGLARLETLPHEDIFVHGGGMFVVMFCQVHLPTVIWYFVDNKLQASALSTPLSDVSIARAFQLALLFALNVLCVRNPYGDKRKEEREEETEFLIEEAKVKAKELDTEYDSEEERVFREDRELASDDDDDDDEQLDKAADAGIRAFLLSPLWALWSIARFVFVYCTDVLLAPTVVSIVYIILVFGIVNDAYGDLLVTSAMSFPGPLVATLKKMTNLGMTVIKKVFDTTANTYFVTFFAMSPLEPLVRSVRAHLEKFVIGPFKTINATVNGFPVNATLDFTDNPDVVLSFVPLVLCAIVMVFQSMSPIQSLLRTHAFWSIASLSAMLPIPMIMYGIDLEPRIWAAIVKNSTFEQVYSDDCKSLLTILVVLTCISLLATMFAHTTKPVVQEEIDVRVIDEEVKTKKKKKGKQ